MHQLRFWGAAVPALLIVLLVATVALVGAQAGDCYSPANLTFNCDFNEYSDQSANSQIRQIAAGWNLWVEAGSLAVDQAFDSPSPPSQRFWSNGDHFTAGLWQQVGGVTPGATYIAGLVWAPHGDQCENCIERKIGIDPTGGTDPYSPAVVWGQPIYDRKPFDIIRTRAVAQNSTITVFIRVHNPMSHGIDEVFLDGAWLYLDPSAPPVQPQVGPPGEAVVAVATAAPPTAVPPSPTPLPPSPTPVPPTATPTPTATPSPMPTSTPSPTPAFTATAMPSATPSPTATASATARPSATATPPPPTATTAPLLAAALAGAGGGWGPVLSGLGVGGALLLGGLAWRRQSNRS